MASNHYSYDPNQLYAYASDSGSQSYEDGVSPYEADDSLNVAYQTYNYEVGESSTAAYSTYTGQTGESYAESPLIPVKLDIDGLYETLRQRKKSSSAEESAASNRRRAQNRASQRAFRDRKERHVKNLEDRIRELERKNNSLTVSYEALKVEFDSVSRELDRLNQSTSDTSLSPSVQDQWTDAHSMYVNEAAFLEEPAPQATTGKKKGKKKH